MSHVLLTILDLGGTFVFAISSAAAGVKHRLGIFVVMILAFAAGCHCQLALSMNVNVQGKSSWSGCGIVGVRFYKSR